MSSPAAKLPPVPRPIRPQVIQELDRFFGCSASDFGLSSNFWPLILRALSGGGGGGSGLNKVEARMVANMRLKNELERGCFVDSKVAIQRAVRRALIALSSIHLEVIVRRYVQFVTQRELVNAYGDVAGIVVLTGEAEFRYASCASSWPEGRGEKPRSVEEWLLFTARAKDEPAVTAVREEAETMVLDAHAAYGALREPTGTDRGCGAFPGRRTRAPRQRRSLAERGLNPFYVV